MQYAKHIGNEVHSLCRPGHYWPIYIPFLWPHSPSPSPTDHCCNQLLDQHVLDTRHGSYLTHVGAYTKLFWTPHNQLPMYPGKLHANKVQMNEAAVTVTCGAGIHQWRARVPTRGMSLRESAIPLGLSRQSPAGFCSLNTRHLFLVVNTVRRYSRLPGGRNRVFKFEGKNPEDLAKGEYSWIVYTTIVIFAAESMCRL